MLTYAIFPVVMIPFDQAHQEFIGYLKEKDRAQATIVAYGKDIEQVLEHAKGRGRKKIDEMIEEDLRDFLGKLEEENYTKKSISRKINSIKTFFRFAKSAEYVTADPSAPITHPKFETPPPRILEAKEYMALRDAAQGDIRTYAIIELLLQTGIRIGELSELTLKNLEINEKTKTGRLTVAESRATHGRTIPLNRRVSEALSAYLRERPGAKKDEPLFMTRTGNPLLVRNIRSSIDRYFKKAGVEKARVNDLRHTWIAYHIKSGASLLLISKLAGHKRLATTEKYLQYVEPLEEEKMELEEL